MWLLLGFESLGRVYKSKNLREFFLQEIMVYAYLYFALDELENLQLAVLAFDYRYIEFQPMFNRPPHLAQVWGPFFRGTETRPRGTGLPLSDP
jgi:hypothetical protein